VTAHTPTGWSSGAAPDGRPARRIALVGLFAALTAVGAQVQTPLPFSPVPVVLSNFFALLAGLVLGARLGATTQAVYVLLGAVGVPVFAGMRGGPQVLVGPTGGYLVGFILAAAAAGALRGPRVTAGRAIAAAAVGAALIYVAGVPWLVHVMGIPWPAAMTGAGLRKVLVAGVLPFLPGDAFKVVVAGLVAPSLVRAVGVQAARL
jgi:biotin transport system substrate-specific component